MPRFDPLSARQLLRRVIEKFPDSDPDELRHLFSEEAAAYIFSDQPNPILADIVDEWLHVALLTLDLEEPPRIASAKMREAETEKQ